MFIRKYHALAKNNHCVVGRRGGANLEELPRVLRDAVGDEHDHVAPRADVADGLAQDAHAEDELVPVEPLLEVVTESHGGSDERADTGDQGVEGGLRGR
jgi:hypothetical protein